MSHETELHLSAKEGYDRWSQFYDQDDVPLNLLEQDVVDRHLGDVSGLTIIDLGCGTGRQTIRLAGKGALVTGVDQSTGMLEKAIEKSSGRIPFLAHDLDSTLPFPAQSFDRVVSFLVLEHISSLVAFFQEAQRLCQPRGMIYFTAMHPAMLLKGVQARYTDSNTGQKVYPKGYAYQISDYLNAATTAGLRLVHLGEYSCTENHAEKSERALKYLNWPLLLTLKFSPR